MKKIEWICPRCHSLNDCDVQDALESLQACVECKGEYNVDFEADVSVDGKPNGWTVDPDPIRL